MQIQFDFVSIIPRYLGNKLLAAGENWLYRNVATFLASQLLPAASNCLQQYVGIQLQKQTVFAYLYINISKIYSLAVVKVSYVSGLYT